MNKLFTKIVGAALGATMAIGVGVAIASNRDVVPTHATSPASVTFSDLSLGNGHVMTDSDVSLEKGLLTFAWNKGSGSTAPTYYDSGTSVRLYCPKSSTGSGLGGKVTISLTNSNYYITSITYYFGGTVTSKGIVTAGSKASVEHSISSSGSVTTATYTSSDNIQSVVFQAKNTNSKTQQCYLSGVSVSYAGGTSPVSVTAVELNKESTTLTTGTTETLTATVKPDNATNKNVTWKSYSDSACTVESNTVASVSNSGVVTANSAGTAYIQVKTEDGGKTDTCVVTVNAPKTPASLTTTGQTTSFETGNTFTYGGTSTVTYTDSTSKSVTPSSFKIGNAGINPISAGTVIVPGTTVLNRNDHHGKTVYVLYEENSTTVYASYTISVAAISKISFVGGTDTGSASGQGQSDTLTKSGISMSCDSCYTTSGAYRFYSGSTLTISSTVGNIAKIEFNMNGSYNSNLLSTSTGTYNHDDSSKGVWTGDAASIAFDLSAQARCDSVDITLASNDPLVELDASSATSVSIFKGDPDTSIKVLVKNIETKTWAFTFDEDEETGKTTSSYISVSAGAAVSDVHTLTITTKAVGSTTLHIAVSGTACATSIPVVVNAKPASMTIVHGDIVAGHLEIQTGQNKQVSFSGLDTDGNPYSIAAADVTGSVESGSTYVSLSGTRIYATSVGSAVVRYTLKALTSIYAEVTVDVVDDYNTTVNSITFNNNLAATQGDEVDTSEVFASKVANTHFGTTATITDSELLFSYDNDRSGAVAINMFAYDFSHGSVVSETQKLQTVYVFVTFDEEYAGTSFNITVTQKNDPLTAITLTNPEIENDEVDLTRGSSLQLTWALTPTNPTDTRELQFSIDDSDEGVKVQVSDTGNVTVSSDSGLGYASVLVEAKYKTSVYTYLLVNVTLESMTYIVDEEESWTIVNDPSTLSAGDQVILTGVKSDVTYAAGTYSGSGNNVPADTENTLTVSGTSVTGVVSSMIYTLEEGTVDGSVAFKDSSGKYLYAASSSNNYMKSQDEIDGNASFILNSDGTVIAQGTNSHNYMRYNNSSTSNLFSCYASTGATGTLVTFYKKSGGETPYTVTEILFNAVHNNFGESGSGATYTWDAQCATFNMSNWTSAGNSVKGIEGFANYKLNYAVSNASGNEIEQFLAKYDNVVAKFYKDCKTDQEKANLDFLGRVSSGKVDPDESRISLIGITTDNGLAITVIIISSMISVAALGGYFFIRRRKHN